MKKKTKETPQENATRLWGARVKIGTAVTAAVVCCVAIMMITVYPYWYQGRVYPGVSVGGVAAGDATERELRAILTKWTDEYSAMGITISGWGTTAVLHPTISAMRDLDLTYDLVTFDIDAMVREAMAAGRDSRRGKFANSISAAGYRAVPLRMPLRFTLDQDKIEEFIRQEFGRYERPSRDAALMRLSDGTLAVSAEQTGEIIDIDRALVGFTAMIAAGSPGPLYLTARTETPRIRQEEVAPLVDDAYEVVARAPFFIKATREEIPTAYPGRADLREEDLLEREISKDEVASWLTLAADGEGPRLGFALLPVQEALREFHTTYDMPAKDAKFAVSEGKVNEFQSSQEGYRIDDEATIARMELSFIMEKKNNAAPVFAVEQPMIKTDAVNGLGIRELLGTGTSNFAGSPKTRRHNIAAGVAAVNGALIPPGSEFSLLTTLGEIDGAHGYLPELVIKGNRTVPEYGGGLCQIGTTSFRAALSAGMPITERRNHSYRVSYYEPAGTDATIYSPSPDFKFMNDTGAYLLFQARTEGDQAVFELWGTSDGRVATTTTPVIYNIVAPPPTKYVKTMDLKPGEVRCTERPHNGADASFTYQVRYPGGDVREEEFKSHYRPWQEVCLVGEDLADGGTEEGETSSMDEIKNDEE